MAKLVYYTQNGSLANDVADVAYVMVALTADEISHGVVQVNDAEFLVDLDVAAKFGHVPAPAVVELTQAEDAVEHIETSPKKKADKAK